jgi:hypothetical protein
MALTDDRAPQVRDLEVETGGERVVAGPRLAGTRAFFDTRAEAPGSNPLPRRTKKRKPLFLTCSDCAERNS